MYFGWLWRSHGCMRRLGCVYWDHVCRGLSRVKKVLRNNKGDLATTSCWRCCWSVPLWPVKVPRRSRWECREHWCWRSHSDRLLIRDVTISRPNRPSAFIYLHVHKQWTNNRLALIKIRRGYSRFFDAMLRPLCVTSSCNWHDWRNGWKVRHMVQFPSLQVHRSLD